MESLQNRGPSIQSQPSPVITFEHLRHLRLTHFCLREAQKPSWQELHILVVGLVVRNPSEQKWLLAEIGLISILPKEIPVSQQAVLPQNTLFQMKIPLPNENTVYQKIPVTKINALKLLLKKIGSGASSGACLWHHLEHDWGMSGAVSGACLWHVWGKF